ncbi:hypothetical protein A5742_04480 [Mycolicibacterium fortuitum]|uniref:Integrase catalytic domain-containing protein n=1 Tax=Mycolicibacterium fortuitum TaxID=1766 RepID=A0ABD6QIF6_MYCFO|nr:hypothetical protein A5742_04480 [Mycolicibacterium fortuitum]
MLAAPISKETDKRCLRSGNAHRLRTGSNPPSALRCACTRLRVLRAYPRSDQKTAIQFLDYVLSRLPFQVEKVQTDNGAEFQSSFHWHVLDQGI